MWFRCVICSAPIKCVVKGWAMLFICVLCSAVVCCVVQLCKVWCSIGVWCSVELCGAVPCFVVQECDVCCSSVLCGSPFQEKPLFTNLIG